MTTPLNASIIKAFRLLSAFKGTRGGLSVVEAAERSGLTVPTAHRFLRTLLSTGAVDLLPTNRYVIGAGLRILANPEDDGETVSGILQHHVQQLATDVRETAHVATLADDMVQYVAKAETPRSLKIATRIGTALEAYCTGVGKLLLAHQPDAYVRSYLETGDFVALTPHTLTTPRQIMAELARIRQQGHALDNEEFEIGLRCIAAPIVVRDRVIAALSCSGPSSRMTDAVIEALIAKTKRRAQLIGRELEQKKLDTLA